MMNCEKYPVSCGSATIDTIELPGAIDQVARQKRYHGNYRDRLTAADRDTLNTKHLYFPPNDFETF